MKVLKEIACEMDCSLRSAQEWVKRLRVPPDLVGHGPNKWREENAARLVKLYFEFFRRAGTTPKLRRAKFSGALPETGQLLLFSEKPCLPPQGDRRGKSASMGNDMRNLKPTKSYAR